jgi:hypothetical protein
LARSSLPRSLAFSLAWTCHDRTIITLEQYRALAADARAALRMIREVVEQHAPPGSVPSEESVEPPFVKEAEVLVKGILAIAAARS